MMESAAIGGGTARVDRLRALALIAGLTAAPTLAACSGGTAPSKSGNALSEQHILTSGEGGR